MQYFDKNGVEIKAGMTIRMEDGSLELVYDTTDRGCGRSDRCRKQLRAVNVR